MLTGKQLFRSSRPEMLRKKSILETVVNSQVGICVGVSFLKKLHDLGTGVL